MNALVAIREGTLAAKHKRTFCVPTSLALFLYNLRMLQILFQFPSAIMTSCCLSKDSTFLIGVFTKASCLVYHNYDCLVYHNYD